MDFSPLNRMLICRFFFLILQISSAQSGTGTGNWEILSLIRTDQPVNHTGY